MNLVNILGDWLNFPVLKLINFDEHPNKCEKKIM